MMKRRF